MAARHHRRTRGVKYFTFTEFERSDTATRYCIDNTTPEWVKKNIAKLVDTVLDPLREAWGKPILVTSGYRCEELNRHVGGAKNSQHLQGQAADITTGNKVDNARLFQLAIDLNLPFDQLIDENNFSWLHISYSPRHRRQILKL